MRFICLISLLLISSASAANPDIAEEVNKLFDAREYGKTYILIWLTFIVAMTGIAGSLVYKAVEQKLTKETRDNIFENEARNLLHLGMRDFENYMDNEHAKLVARTTLLSAISHTTQAINMLSKMSKPVTYLPRSSLIALTGGNLGYYYTELMRCLPARDTKLKEKYRELALKSIGDANVHINACRRRLEHVDCLWWQPYESMLHVQYHCLKDKLDEAKWEHEEKLLQATVKELSEDNTIPVHVRFEIKNDWEDLLNKGQGD